jgi:hypothetical protein
VDRGVSGVRTTKQRMEALDRLVADAEREMEHRPDERIARIVELLREYRSWNDDPPGGDDDLVLVSAALFEEFAALLSRTRDQKVGAALLAMALDVHDLEESVPYAGDRRRRALRSALSVPAWAERVARLPDGSLRDLAAYPLDLVHVLFGDHHGGEECRTLAGAFSDGDTVATRLIGPAYRLLLERIP